MSEIRIPVKDFTVGATLFGAGGTLVALGHGAGGNRKTPFLVRAAESLAGSGRRALLFDFPYTDSGRKAPDRPEVLEMTVEGVATHARTALGAKRLVLGGKSMGGRIASQAVAAGLPAEGLVFLGYPLHPPGKTQQRRDRHLPKIAAPMLFVQGNRDAFARWDLVEATVERLGRGSTLHRVEDGDHSFLVRKSSGRSSREAEAEVVDVVLRWLDARGL